MVNIIDSTTSRAAEPRVEPAASVEHAAPPPAADNRAQIAMEIRAAKDPQKLKDLVGLYMLEATRNDKIPGDRLESIKNEIIKLRPGDRGLAGQVRELGERLALLWQAQGRTHEVWDKLVEFTGKGNWAGVKAEVTNQLATLVATSPTIQHVANYKDNVLLAYGPKQPGFKNAVDNAVHDFITADPAAVASLIARVYDSQGPKAAAQLLREFANPALVTPLQAALILNKAKPTIDKICQAFLPTRNGGILDFVAKLPKDPLQQPQQEMFNDLAAAVDSASRSPEAAHTIEQIGAALCRGPVYAYVQESVADGNLALALEMLTHLKGPRDGGSADGLSRSVKDGLGVLRARVERFALQYAKTVQPRDNPPANWDALLGPPFKTSGQIAKQWEEAHRDVIPRAQSDLENLIPDGYRVTRAIAALDQYVPRLPWSAADEMHKLRTNPAMAFAQAVSPPSMIEAARMANTKGLQSMKLVDPHKIGLDPSWPLRAMRNQVQSDIRSVSGKAPFGFGLSLFGTGTYIWGAANQLTEFSLNYGDPGYMLRRGWRVLGFLGMYAVGTGIEGSKVLGHIAGKWQPDQGGWRGFAAQGADNVKGSKWDKVFRNHLKAFGWFNVVGSGWYFIHGDNERGTAVGTAGIGTLVSQYGAELAKGTKIGVFRLATVRGASNMAAGRLAVMVGGRVAALTGPVGTALVVLGSAGLYYYNMRDRERLAQETKPFNEDYLRRAGLKREIAEKLTKNDSDGLSAGPRLVELAKYLGVTPPKLLQYLNEQDPGWVGDFVEHALLSVKPNQQGQYPVSGRGAENLGLAPPDPRIWRTLRNPSLMWEAKTLKGIDQWAAETGHVLPRR